DERERLALPERIERLEADLERLGSRMADPDFYRRDAADIAADQHTLQELEAALVEAYERWESLEAQAQSVRAQEPERRSST
ncbi:MAG TPA: hypothetical protein DDW89_07260, partial [Gammaproteobacteria bacterium]|nr:hypothetical protein [Gammaproteobacteria bacterium]